MGPAEGELIPTYVYKCERCEYELALRSSVEERDVPLLCTCNGWMKRKFTPATIIMPSNQWADHTRKDLLPDEKGEYARGKVFPLSGKKSGVWM